MKASELRIGNLIKGVYYKHDDENVFKGYALIIGNNSTPYAYGYYFFEFTFPKLQTSTGSVVC